MSFPGSEADAAAGLGAGDGKAGEEIASSGSVFAVLQAYATHVFAPVVRGHAAARGGDDKASVLSLHLNDETRVRFIAQDVHRFCVRR